MRMASQQRVLRLLDLIPQLEPVASTKHCSAMEQFFATLTPEQVKAFISAASGAGAMPAAAPAAASAASSASPPRVPAAKKMPKVILAPKYHAKKMPRPKALPKPPANPPPIGSRKFVIWWRATQHHINIIIDKEAVDMKRATACLSVPEIAAASLAAARFSQKSEPWGT